MQDLWFLVNLFAQHPPYQKGLFEAALPKL
jgi:hypothetical protein